MLTIYRRGFSLIEVVLALGLVSFALVALLGLFTVSLKSNQESSSEVQASHIMSSLLAQRRTTPKDPEINGIPSHPKDIVLPALDIPTAGSPWIALDVDSSGQPITSGEQPAFRLHYQIAPMSAGTTSRVTLMLSWPVKPGVGLAAGAKRLEVTSYIFLK